MFTKPEQPETVRFSNYSGLSFSLSCSSFGRAPLHSLPQLPPAAPQPWIWKAMQGLRISATSRHRAGSMGSGFLPQQEQGAQAGDSSSHVPSSSVITGAHGIHVRQSLGVLQLHQRPHFQKIKLLCTLTGGKTSAQAAKRGGRCPVPGTIQGQIEQGFEHPGLVEDPYRRVCLDGLERSLPAQTIVGWLPVYTKCTNPIPTVSHSPAPAPTLLLQLLMGRSVAKGNCWFIPPCWSGCSMSHPCCASLVRTTSGLNSSPQ